MTVGFVGAFSSIDLPGTGTPSLSGEEDETKCNLYSEIQVDSNIQSGVPVVGGDALELREPSFYYEVSESGLFGLTFMGANQQLSWFTAENARVTYTLNGPIDGQLREVEELDDIGTLTDRETSSFSTRGLPEGDYTLDIDLTWEGGSDSQTEELSVDCGGS